MYTQRKKGTIVTKGCFKKPLVRAIAYDFSDTLFSDSHSPNFLIKNA